MHFLSLTALILAVGRTHASWLSPSSGEDAPGLAINDVPYARREHWMRVANEAIYNVPHAHPCPPSPFGTVIVNTTSDEMVCFSANAVRTTGDPTLHGEVAAIRECTSVLAARGLSPAEIMAAWPDFSLYTNGEPCPMCAAAIRWAGFKELVYGTSADKLAAFGFATIPAGMQVWEAAHVFEHGTRRITDVLAAETDPMFRYQYIETGACPPGCKRETVPGKRVSQCRPTSTWRDEVRRAGRGVVAELKDEL